MSAEAASLAVPVTRGRRFSVGQNLTPRLSVAKGDSDDEQEDILDTACAPARNGASAASLGNGGGDGSDELDDSVGEGIRSLDSPSTRKAVVPGTVASKLCDRVCPPLPQWACVPFMTFDVLPDVATHIEYAEKESELIELWINYVHWTFHREHGETSVEDMGGYSDATPEDGDDISLYDSDEESISGEGPGGSADISVHCQDLVDAALYTSCFGGSRDYVDKAQSDLADDISSRDLTVVLQAYQVKKRVYPQTATLRVIWSCLEQYRSQGNDKQLPKVICSLFEKIVASYLKGAFDLAEVASACRDDINKIRLTLCELVCAVTERETHALQQRYDDLADMFDDFDSINFKLDGPRPSGASISSSSGVTPGTTPVSKGESMTSVAARHRSETNVSTSTVASVRSATDGLKREERAMSRNSLTCPSISIAPQMIMSNSIDVEITLSSTLKTVLANYLCDWISELEQGGVIRDTDLFQGYLQTLAAVFDSTEFNLDLTSKYFRLLWDLNLRVSHMAPNLREAALLAFQSLAARSLKQGAEYLISSGSALFEDGVSQPSSEYYLVSIAGHPCYVTLNEYVAAVSGNPQTLDDRHVAQIRALVTAPELLRAAKTIFFRAIQPQFAQQVIDFIVIWMRSSFIDFNGQAEASADLAQLLNARDDLRAAYDDLDSRLHTADSLVTALMTTSEGLDSVDMKYCLMVYQWFLKPEDFFKQMVNFLRRYQDAYNKKVSENPHWLVTKECNSLRWNINVKVVVISTVVKTWVSRFFSDWSPERTNLYSMWREFVRSFPKTERLEAMEEASYLAKEELEAYYTGNQSGLHIPPREEDYFLQKLQRVGLIPPWYSFSMGSSLVQASIYWTTLDVASHSGSRLPQELDLLSEKGIIAACEAFTTIDAMMYRNLRRLVGSTFRQGAKSVNSDSCNGESVLEWRAQMRNAIDDILERRMDTMKMFVMNSLAGQPGAQERADMLAGLIRLARILKKENSLHTATLLTQAVLSKEVQALEQTWKLLASDAKSKLKELEKMIQPTDNYAALCARFEKAKKGKLSRIPYLGALAADLYRIGEAGAELQAHSDEVIPWARWRELAVMIDQFVHDPRPYGFSPPSELLRAAALMDKTIYSSPEGVFKERLERQLSDIQAWEKYKAPEELFFIDLRETQHSINIFRGTLIRRLALVRLSIAAGCRLRPVTIMLGTRSEHDPVPPPAPTTGRPSLSERFRRLTRGNTADKNKRPQSTFDPRLRRRRGGATGEASSEISESFDESCGNLYTTHIAGRVSGSVVSEEILQKWLVETYNM